MNERQDDAAERTPDALDAVARAMTAHPVPDVRAAVRARLGGRRVASAPRPMWAMATLVSAALVVFGVRLVPERPAPASPDATVARGPRPPAPAAAVALPQVRPAPRVGARAVSPSPVAAARPVVPAEPWPGDELRAEPLRLAPLTEPSLALDGIGLAPLAGPAPLEFEAVDVSGRGEEE